jgi:arylsulfatase A-like enzyme
MAVLLALLAWSACSAESGPPNFVFIIVDDLGRQDVGVYGSDWYETPNMDALAGGAHPRCVPSRLGIMSGRYPAALGIPGFQDRSTGEHALPLSTVTFAEVLRNAGYRTAYIGKWHLGKDGGGPAEQGFTTSIMAGASGAPPSYFLPYEVSRKISDSKSFPDYAGGPPDEYLTDRLTDEALAFQTNTVKSRATVVCPMTRNQTSLSTEPVRPRQHRITRSIQAWSKASMPTLAGLLLSCASPASKITPSLS